MPIHDSEEPSQPLSRQLIGSHSKLNLGCGFDNRKDYLNVDMHAFTNPDLLANVTDLSMLPSAAYDEILAQDVLEHFRWSDTPRALFEWNRLQEGRIPLHPDHLHCGIG
jgi:predicted SAM-dependent methyltransferase